MSDTPNYSPLHQLDSTGPVATAGRVRHLDEEDDWRLENARASRRLRLPDELETSSLDGGLALDRVHRPEGESTVGEEIQDVSIGEALVARDRAKRRARSVFEASDFLEVQTPHAIDAPGTDLYLKPIGTRRLSDQERPLIPSHLHTSPEFEMKRLLTEGAERIYQFAKVWRNGEMTDWHHPEFTLLEWYRAWEELEAIQEDVEAVVEAVVGDTATIVERTSEDTERRTVDLDPPFERVTMQQLVDDACGFDLLEALDYDGLWRACDEHDLLPGRFEARHPREGGRWDDLFFELMVTRIEPELAERGAVFVTEWPAPLAVLARKHADDPRVAERFELYVGGVELANGFHELTDPDEQRSRFEHEIEERSELDMPPLPMPDAFLEALEYGLPRRRGSRSGSIAC